MEGWVFWPSLVLTFLWSNALGVDGDEFTLGEAGVAYGEYHFLGLATPKGFPVCG